MFFVRFMRKCMSKEITEMRLALLISLLMIPAPKAFTGPCLDNGTGNPTCMANGAPTGGFCWNVNWATCMQPPFYAPCLCGGDHPSCPNLR